jgi:hypothetical protein
MVKRNDVEQETLQSAQKTLKPAKKIGKKILSKSGKAISAILAPYLPAILIIIAILLLLWFIVGAIFSSTPQGELFTGPLRTLQDEELKKQYNEIKDKNNKRDKWLVPGEKESGTWYEEINTDIVIEKFAPTYKDKILTNEDIQYIIARYNKYYTDQDLDPPVKHYYQSGDLKDHYNRDAEYLETFGLIHSGSVWHMLICNEEHTTDEFKELTGVEFRPYLYYKSSSITITFVPNDPEAESSTTVIPLYLIVEGNGLRDHQTYHYEWRTETSVSSSGTTTTTWEELVGQTSINPWQRLDDWVQEKYEIPEDKKDEIEIARMSVWEAGIGYTEATERLEWLFSGQIDSRYLSQSFIPDNIMSAFHAAEDMFGIPAWFLAALAMKESSLNPEAHNKTSGAFGLFQLTEGARKATVDTLIVKYSNKLPPQLIELYNNSVKDDDFYKQVLKDPYVNTLAGCLVFIDKCNNNNISDIDWDGNWLEQILPALTDYGGFLSVPENLWPKYGIKNENEAKLKENRQKWCHDEYASVIEIHAERFQIEKAMPVDGLILANKKDGGHITDKFGPRKHPKTGQDSFHTGVDLAFSVGTPMRSVAPGKVEYAGYDKIYGNMVIIAHGAFKTHYAHASSINVRVGEFVNAGKMIARVGNTGLSTGPHLHFEVHTLDSTGHFNPIDPLIFLSK